MASFCTGQPGQHAHSVRGFDFYATPVVAVTAVLDAQPEGLHPSSSRLWDPSAGDGGTAVPLRERGFAVICSDIVQRDFPLHFVGDFFARRRAPAGVTTILTNTPYQQAQRFAEHALELVPSAWPSTNPFVAPNCSSTAGFTPSTSFAADCRACTAPIGPVGARRGSVCFAWFRWRRSYRGPPILTRI